MVLGSAGIGRERTAGAEPAQASGRIRRKRGESVEDGLRPATDAALASTSWPVAPQYVVTDALDTVDTTGRGWLTLRGMPTWQERDGSPLRRDDRQLAPPTMWVRLIREVSPPGTPKAGWVPVAKSGLASQLAELATADEATLVGWVARHGFLGVRANPWEWRESVEEIREALSRLAQARALLRAIRSLKGDALRSEVEHQLSLPPGLLDRVKADPGQPLAGEKLARAFGISVPAGERWPGAGAHVQALYSLLTVLDEPIQRLLRVGLTIAQTQDGMRIQGAMVGAGPLATAYLETLDEASWPTISYAGSVLTLHWHSPRRCPRCGNSFRPQRRDQKWCSARCRWAASKSHSG